MKKQKKLKRKNKLVAVLGELKESKNKIEIALDKNQIYVIEGLQ